MLKHITYLLLGSLAILLLFAPIGILIFVLQQYEAAVPWILGGILVMRILAGILVALILVIFEIYILGQAVYFKLFQRR